MSMTTGTEHLAETVPLVAVISTGEEDRAALAEILDHGEGGAICVAARKDAAGMVGQASGICEIPKAVDSRG